MRSFFIITLLFTIHLLNIAKMDAQTGGALDFDGVNDYVNLGNISATNFGTSNFTIEFWLKTSQASNSVVLSKRSDCNCSNFWNIIMESNGQLRYEASQNNSCSNYAALNTTIAINNGQWRHFAFVRNGNNVSIYINGSLNNSATLSLTNLNNTDQVHLGRSACSGLFADYLDGQMDEVRIWNFNRTPTQISTNMNCPLSGPETGLIAYYTFNQGIADGNNIGITSLTPLAGPTGTLMNFTLNGTSSNWVTGIVGLPPVFSACPTIINQNTDSGVCTAVVTYTVVATGTPAPTYSFAFTGVTMASGSGTGTGSTFNVGTTTVTITASNGCSPNAVCSFDVTVQDNIPPTAICQDVTISLDNTGMVTIPGSSVNNNSTDNCTASLSYSLSTSTFDCTNLGANAVVLTVTDPGGLIDNCNATVTVEDNLPPVLECRNLTVELDNNGQISVDANNLLFEYPEYLIYDSGLSGWGPAGACGARRRGSTAALESFTWVDELSSLSGVGSIQIEISMHFSQTNNPYTFSLNGTDIGQEFGIGLGACLVDVKVIQLDLSLYNVGGTNTFSWNLPDGEHALITNLGWNESFARVVITGMDPSLSDNCSDMNSIVLNPSTFQFTCNDVGNNTVTLEAIDEYSNAASCTTTVTVQDNIPPFTSCQNVTISLGNNGEVILPALSVDNGSSDACGIMSFNLSQTTFTCDHLGSNIVTLTVIDNNSNPAVCTATVTVQDVSPPTAVCQDITINLDNIGMISISGTDINDNSTDNCLASLSYSLSTSTFDCGNIGANTVVLTVTDGGLLNSTCESTVTVTHIFATIADGDYALPTTWSGGCIPPNPIPVGAMININHDLENNDLLTNNGTITSTTDFINNGTYQGTGTFNGNFINNGIVKPGTGN